PRCVCGPLDRAKGAMSNQSVEDPWLLICHSDESSSIGQRVYLTKTGVATVYELRQWRRRAEVRVLASDATRNG
ncbi:MAG: hypothetical protein QOD97_3810, partial [Mycobacterium sp.]|nr:hypothetical protein [Mycobacterium sp.]